MRCNPRCMPSTSFARRSKNLRAWLYFKGSGEEKIEGVYEVLAKTAPIHDRIQHAVREQELRALKPFGKLLADGLLDYPRTSEPDKSARFRQVQVSKHGVARCNSAGSWIGKDRDKW